MYTDRKCKNCGCHLPANPRNKDQQYCNRKPCQKKRKAEWQRRKLQADAQYRQDQKEAQAEWRRQNPDYWKKYRAANPAFAEKNRKAQKARDLKRRNQGPQPDPKMDGFASGATQMDASDHITVVITDGCDIRWPVLAKMDALTGHFIITLVPCNGAEKKPHLAKMDASENVYTVITESS
jgi:hypothetical protein